MNPLDLLRRADWLTDDRARSVCRVLFWVSLAATLGTWFAPRGWGLFQGDPRDIDFLSFWTAAQLALEGRPGAAYDPEAIRAAEAALIGARGEAYAAFMYPPTFLMLCLPLGLLGYGAAVLAWLAGTAAAWLVVARRFLPASAGIIGLLALPAAWNNVWHGQNGFLSAALLGGGGLLLERRPFLAGLLLGCLSYKPQLGLLVAPALLAARRWAAVAGATVAVLVLAGASVLAFGWDSWAAFLRNSALTRLVLENELYIAEKLQSPFAAVRVLGGGVALAYAVQAVASLVALAVVVAFCWRRVGGVAETALVAAAAALASPYVFDYDLTLLALPMGWVLLRAEADGAFLPWERAVLAAAFLLALLARPLAMKAGLPVGPLVIAALLAVVARRAGAPPPRAA